MGKAAGKKRPNAVKKGGAVSEGAAFIPGAGLKRLAGRTRRRASPRTGCTQSTSKEGRRILKMSRMLSMAYPAVRDRPVSMRAGNLKGRFDRRRRARILIGFFHVR